MFKSNFDYDIIINCNSDDDGDYNNSKQTTNYFDSSVCFSKKRIKFQFWLILFEL